MLVVLVDILYYCAFLQTTVTRAARPVQQEIRDRQHLTAYAADTESALTTPLSELAEPHCEAVDDTLSVGSENLSFDGQTVEADEKQSDSFLQDLR